MILVTILLALPGRLKASQRSRDVNRFSLGNSSKARYQLGGDETRIERQLFGRIIRHVGSSLQLYEFQVVSGFLQQRISLGQEGVTAYR